MVEERRSPADPPLVLVLLSALGVAVATLSPMLLRAAQATALAEAVERVPVADRSITDIARADDGDSLNVAFDAAGRPGLVLTDPRIWMPPTSAAATFVVPWRADTGSRAAQLGELVATSTGFCEGLRLAAGTCPVNASDAALPLSLARHLEVRLDSTLTVFPNFRPHRRTLRIVGVYDDGTGYGRVLTAPDGLTGPPVSAPTHGLLVGRHRLGSLGLASTAYSAVTVRSPVHLDDLETVRSDFRAARTGDQSALAGRTEAAIRSGLPALLAKVQLQLDAAATLTAAVTVEAAVLSWFALAATIQRISRVQAPEWGIGRTRGSRQRVWLATVFAQPTIAIVAGSIAGFVLGVLIARLVATVTGSPGAADPFQPVVPAAAAATLAGSFVALVAASVRSAWLPPPRLLRQTTEPRTLSRPALVAQAGAMLVTAVVLWIVLAQNSIGDGQVALLLPSLVPLVLGIAALRTGVVGVRRGTSGPPASLAGLVIGRGLARAPSALGAAVMAAVGVSLVTRLCCEKPAPRAKQ